MKINLYVPELKDYWYEEKLLADPMTMEYNAGYDVSYDGYDYNTGCIKFPKTKWQAKYEKRKSNKEYFAYIKELSTDTFIGYVYYHYNEKLKHYDCGILVEAKYRELGYANEALKLLCDIARENGIHELYDNFEINRTKALKLFENSGFKIDHITTWKRFNKEVRGVIVKIEL